MKNKFGYGQNQRCKVGDVVIRTRHKRNHEKRAYIKVAEPSVWVLRARHVWESAHGPIPPGMGIHHKDENKLNDKLNNLELVNKAMHLSLHRKSFQDKCVAALARARKKRKWSTKSKTKITGRHPNNCQCPLHRR